MLAPSVSISNIDIIWLNNISSLLRQSPFSSLIQWSTASLSSEIEPTSSPSTLRSFSLPYVYLSATPLPLPFVNLVRFRSLRMCLNWLLSVNYARKKTKKTITISLAALEGAACMNNTFCLGIFLCLVYFKSLIWEFSAETISIHLRRVRVGSLLHLQKDTNLVGCHLHPLLVPVVL